VGTDCQDAPVLVRAALCVLALLAIGWLGLLYRDVRIGQAATDVLLTERNLSHAEVAREIDRLRDAKLLDPDRQWDQKIAFFLMVDRPREALWIANELATKEPDNVEVWRVVEAAAQRIDPRRAAEARAERRRLNPPLTGGD
jgi:hypothetical protein